MTKLFSPGPTPLAQTTFEALQAPPLHHRSKSFMKVIEESLLGLKQLFDEEHLVVLPSTGTGALEASVVNFLSSEDSTLSLNGGKFGARWSEILNAYKVKNFEYSFAWGEEPDLQKMTELLKEHQPKALFMQACETSTGTKYETKPISNLIKEHSPKTLLVVDGVTAVGAFKLSMKENGIDVLTAGSQKALGLPVGLSFLGFSQKAHLAAEKSNLPKYYFNVLKELEAHKKNTSVFSSPTQMWRALNAELKNTKFEQKYTDCENLQNLVSAWAKENNLKIFSKNPSPSLTALLLPEGLFASKIQKVLIDKGYYIATGQGDYSDKLLRIGHMANITPGEMTTFLEQLASVLKEFGH